MSVNLASCGAGSQACKCRSPGACSLSRQCPSTPCAPSHPEPNGLSPHALCRWLPWAIQGTGTAEAGCVKPCTQLAHSILGGQFWLLERGICWNGNWSSYQLPGQSIKICLPPLTHRPGRDGLGAVPADVLTLAYIKSGDTQELDLWVTIAKRREGIKKQSHCLQAKAFLPG